MVHVGTPSTAGGTRTKGARSSSRARLAPRRARARAGRLLAAGLAVVGIASGGCATAPPLDLSAGLFPGYRGIAPWLSDRGDIGVDPLAFAVRQTLLPSGLRVGFERAPTRGMVGVVLVVGSGSTEDPAGKEGLAHLVEHLTYHATLEGGPAAATLARLGAVYNADTSLDRTRYYEFAPASELPRLLRLAARRLTRTLDGVDRHDVEVEREIVRNELRQRNETGVYGQVVTWMQGALFPASHPYARSVGGTSESLGRLTLADAQAFIAGRYQPARATLLIVGDSDAAEGLAAAVRDLPAELAGDPARPVTPLLGVAVPRPTALPAAPPGGVTTWRVGVTWPEIWLAYALPDAYGRDAPPMKVLTDPAIEARVREVIGRDPDVSGVEMISLEYRQASVLAFRIELLRPERRAQITALARSTIAGVRELFRPPNERGANPDEAETWADTRRQALARAILQAEAFTSRAPERAEYFHMTGYVEAYDRLIGAVAALPADALLPHATALLSPDRARVLYLDPLPEALRPAPGAVGLPSPTRSSKGGGRHGGPIAPLPAAADFGATPALPPVKEMVEAERYMLPNGMRVALLPAYQFPSVAVALGFSGGVAASPPGTVELLRRLESDGTFRMKQNAVEVDKLDSDDLTADVVATGERNIGNALFMIGLRLRALDQITWDPVLAKASGRLDQLDKESPGERATRTFWRALYPEHPYGRIMQARDLRGVTPVGLKDAMAHLYNPRNATLVIAGDFHPWRVRLMIDTWFSRWQGRPGTGPLEIAPVPALAKGPRREQVIVTARPGLPQVEVAVGCRLPPGNDLPSYAADRMLFEALASRLNRSLRDEAGLSYGVGGGAGVLQKGAGHLILRTAVDNKGLPEALKILRAQWAHFARAGFDAGTVSQVRWSLFKTAALRFQTATELAVGELTAANENWNTTELARLPEVYARVSPADLAARFTACRANMVMSLLGDEAVIRRALDTAPDADGS